MIYLLLLFGEKSEVLVLFCFFLRFYISKGLFFFFSFEIGDKPQRAYFLSLVFNEVFKKKKKKEKL